MNIFETKTVFMVLRNSTTINDLESADHGPAHWARVWENGQRLAAKTPGCDLLVVSYFALFHDAMRENDFEDPEHGERGYKLAFDLRVHKLLTAQQWEDFHAATAWHEQGLTSTDPTIGVCWDADRLDLPRVGITPDPRLMSTEAAGVELGVIDE